MRVTLALSYEKTIRNIKHVYIENLQALVEDGKITKYRVNAKVSFVVD